MIDLQYIRAVKLVVREFDLTITDLYRLVKLAENIVVAIDLSNTNITGAGMTGFHAPQLEDLNLSGCWISDSELLELLADNCAKLKRLDLSETNITGAGLTGLHAPQLEDLNLSYCEDLTDSGLMELLANSCDKLKRLDLSGTSITSAGLDKVRSLLPQCDVCY